MVALGTRLLVKWDDQRIRLTRFIHKWLGIAIFLFALVVNALGLFYYYQQLVKYHVSDGKLEYSYFISHVVVSVFMIILPEFFYQRARYGKEATLCITNREF